MAQSGAHGETPYMISAVRDCARYHYMRLYVGNDYICYAVRESNHLRLAVVYHYGIGRHIWDIPLNVNGVWDRNVGNLPTFPIALSVFVESSNPQAFVHRRHDIFVGNLFREDGNLAAL